MTRPLWLRCVMLLAGCWLCVRQVRRLGPGGWLDWSLYAAGLLLIVCACGPAPVPVPPPPPRPADFDPVAACKAGEARLFDLQCKRADGSPWWKTPGGRSYSDECQIAWADSRDWHADSTVCIANCSEIEASYRGEIRCEP